MDRLLVHCHAGVSRSTASAVLLLAQRDPARDPGDIVDEVVRRRPQAWPNLRIVEIGDRLLGRRGPALWSASAPRPCRGVVARAPDYADPELLRARRPVGREVDG